MKALILFAMLATFQAANAQVNASTSNFLGFTDAEIVASQQTNDPIKTAFAIEKYVEELGSFHKGLKAYFLFKSQSSSNKFLSVSSFVRTQQGVWWEENVQKRKTIYLLRFVFSNGWDAFQNCQIKFSRVESQSGATAVVPIPSTLVCTSI